MGVVETPRKNRGNSRTVTTLILTSDYLQRANSLGIESCGMCEYFSPLGVTNKFLTNINLIHFLFTMPMCSYSCFVLFSAVMCKACVTELA